MDLTQIVIVISLLAVSGIIVACGIYMIGLLKELKVTVQKTNTILDDAESITQSIAKPVSSFSEFVMGFRNGVAIFNKFFKKDKDET